MQVMCLGVWIAVSTQHKRTLNLDCGISIQLNRGVAIQLDYSMPIQFDGIMPIDLSSKIEATSLNMGRLQYPSYIQILKVLQQVKPVMS